MNSESERRIGLLAGAGEIPVYFARKAHENGIRLVSIGFSDEIQSSLVAYSEKSYSIGVGRWSKMSQALKKDNIEDLLILGKVDKSVIFRPQLFDLGSLKFLKNIRNREDKTLLLGVIEEMAKGGFRVLDQREFMMEIFPKEGILSKRQPTQEEMEEVAFGFPIAKKLADMEIGQTLVVRNKTVIAVEGIEGTDRAIERGCQLAKDNSVVIKVSRTGQDYRYDCPGIGPQTVEIMAQGGARVLALESDRVLLVEQARAMETADRAGIAVISFRSPESE
jgi:DUF1009 family protein